jgi:hypothetical protein
VVIMDAVAHQPRVDASLYCNVIVVRTSSVCCRVASDQSARTTYTDTQHTDTRRYRYTHKNTHIHEHNTTPNR